MGFDLKKLVERSISRSRDRETADLMRQLLNKNQALEKALKDCQQHSNDPTLIKLIVKQALS